MVAALLLLRRLRVAEATLHLFRTGRRRWLRLPKTLTLEMVAALLLLRRLRVAETMLHLFRAGRRAMGLFAGFRRPLALATIGITAPIRTRLTSVGIAPTSIVPPAAALPFGPGVSPSVFPKDRATAGLRGAFAKAARCHQCAEDDWNCRPPRSSRSAVSRESHPVLS